MHKTKKYDLEERTFQYAKDVRTFLKTIPKTISNKEDGKQLVRSSGSVGANYREGNGSNTLKEKLYRLRLSRKEANESLYWLRLIIETNNLSQLEEGKALMKETLEICKILTAIIEKLK